MSRSARASTADAAALLDHARAMTGAGRSLEAIDLLHRDRPRDEPDPAVEARLVALRHAAFAEVSEPGLAEWPPAPTPCGERVEPRLPEIDADDLDAQAVRDGIMNHGSLLVRGLLQPQVERFVAGIERAFAAKAAHDPTSGPDAWYHPLMLPREEAQLLGRHFVAGDGAILGCDSPKLLNDVFDAYEEVGLRQVVSGYLGERPILSANKCTLRHVRLEGGTDWHQDGAFLGEGIRVLNVWVALSDCGVDAPGLDVVPRRFDHVLETGTGGAFFDWSVGSAVVEKVSEHAPVLRPSFQAGDVMLFDELFLHRTALDASMTRRRYAIESWFFAPSTYPEGQVPIVW